jgi:hypothetical protein
LHVFIYLSPRSYKYPTGEARKCLDAHTGTAQKNRRRRQDARPIPVNALVTAASRMTWWMVRLITWSVLEARCNLLMVWRFRDGSFLSLTASSIQFEMSRK